MQIQDAQKAVDEWIHHHGVRYFNELTNMAQLTVLLAHYYHATNPRPNLLVHVLVYINSFCF